MSATPPASSPTGQMVPVPRGGTTVARQSVTGSQEVALSGETSTMASAAMVRAQVEARYAMARQFPRSLMETRDQLLRACERPRFAEVAIYHKPVGKGIEGPSIRLAEEAARCMRNIFPDSEVLYDDREKRIIKVTATDLEANLTYSTTIVVTKTVERSKVPLGQTARSQRYNSTGVQVFEVDATDDDILNKVNSLTSKALRTLILRLVPGDIMEDAIDACYATRAAKYQEDPHAAIKKMCDAFGKAGVPVKQLAEYLGHAVDHATLEEVDELRSLYTAIKDGETTWRDAMDKRLQELSASAAAAHGVVPANDAPAEPTTAAAAGAAAVRGKPAAPNLTDVAQNAAAARGASAPGATLTRQQVIDKARDAGRSTYDWEGKSHKVPGPAAKPTARAAESPASAQADIDKRHEDMISGPPPPLDQLDKDAPEPGSEG
jgi:hypothetical protein